MNYASRRLTVTVLALSLAAYTTFGAIKVSTRQESLRKSARVEVQFAKSPFADYLFYLLNRSTRDFPQLKTAVPLDGIPAVNQLTFAPEDAISSNISSYSQLYQMVASYDDHVRLTDIIKRGEPKYAAFEEFWKAKIAPEEDRHTAEWERQYVKWHPFERLQQLERIKFPFPWVNVDVIALDPSGSSMQGAHPTIFTVYSSIPDLAWVIGHEGTHMALGPKGANWTQRPGAAEAIRIVKARGGSEYDIEEALCLLMQVKLSQSFRGTPGSYSESSKLDASPRRELLARLERDWTKYRKNSKEDAADFVIREALQTFRPMPGSTR